jgi:hypothetical protein
MQSQDGMRPLDELHAMAQRVADEHRANSRACDKRWCDELEARRQQLAAAAAQLTHR